MRRFAAGILVGLSAALVVLATASLSTRVGSGGTDPLQTVELKTYDWRLSHTAQPGDRAHRHRARRDRRRLAAEPAAERRPLAVAARRALEPDRLSRARAGAKLIAYDVDFAEPDTRVGFKYGDATWSGAESDKALADSIKAAGNVILLADATYDADTPEVARLPDERLSRSTSPGSSSAAASCRRSPGSPSARAGARPQPVRPRSRRPAAPHRSRSCAAAAACCRRSASRRRCARPAFRPRDVRLDGTVLRFGDRAMPLAWRRVQHVGRHR